MKQVLSKEEVAKAMGDMSLARQKGHVEFTARRTKPSWLDDNVDAAKIGGRDRSAAHGRS